MEKSLSVMSFQKNTESVTDERVKISTDEVKMVG